MKLTPTQLTKLHQSEIRIREARAALARETAIQQDLIEMVLDAHGAPLHAQIDLQTGFIIVPPPPDAGPQGVSESAAVEPAAPEETGNEKPESAEGAD